MQENIISTLASRCFDSSAQQVQGRTYTHRTKNTKQFQTYTPEVFTFEKCDQMYEKLVF